MKPIRHRLAIAALLASIGSAAFAQAAPAAPAVPPAPAHAQQHDRGPGRFDPQRAEAHFARKLDVLKTRLQLTPQQEGAWTQYTTAIKPPARPADGAGKRFGPHEFEKLTTPERLDRLRTLRQEHTARAEQREQAVRTFYAALNPAQKKVYDLESLPRHRPGFHRGGGHGGGEHGPRGGEGRPQAPAAAPAQR